MNSTINNIKEHFFLQILRGGGVLAAFIFLSLLQLQGQNIRADLKGLNSGSMNAEKLHVKLIVNVFASDQDDLPFMTQAYEVKKSGKKLFYKLNDQRILINDKCVITISDKGKTLIYTKNNGQGQELPKDNISLNLDSLVNEYDSIQYRGILNGEKHYTIYQQKSIIPVIDIYFNAAGKKLSRLIYHYDKTKYPTNNLVEISYSKWLFSPTFSAQEFSEKKYIKKINNKIQLVSALQDYELILNE